MMVSVETNRVFIRFYPLKTRLSWSPNEVNVNSEISSAVSHDIISTLPFPEALTLNVNVLDSTLMEEVSRQ